MKRHQRQAFSSKMPIKLRQRLARYDVHPTDCASD